MKYVALILALFFCSCQPKIKHEVQGKIEPVEVRHHIVLDTKALFDAFLIDCQEEFADPDEAKKCADDKLNDFIEKFTYST